MPIWEAGIAVFILNDPQQVTSSFSTIHEALQVEKPVDDASCLTKDMTPDVVAEILGVTVGIALLSGEAIRSIEVTATRLLIYRYEAQNRLANTNDDVSTLDRALAAQPAHARAQSGAADIEESQHYVVREVLFTLNLRQRGAIHWRAFVEVETCSVLYLRAFVAGFSGDVFPLDPPSASGDMTILPSAIDTFWTNGPRSHAPGVEEGDPTALEGHVHPDSGPVPAARCRPRASRRNGTFSFEPESKADDFSAVSAYYHCDDAFRLVGGMSFSVKTYFKDTKFPVKVDHCATPSTTPGGCVNGDCVNAQTFPNPYSNGVESFQFALLSTPGHRDRHG